MEYSIEKLIEDKYTQNLPAKSCCGLKMPNINLLFWLDWPWKTTFS